MTFVAIMLLLVVVGGAGVLIGSGWATKGVADLMSDMTDADFDIPAPGEPGHLDALRNAARCGQALWDRLRSVRNPV